MAKGVRAVKRVTRKELKEDKFVTTYFRARQYIEEHQGFLLKIAGGVALVIVLVAFWFMSKSGAQSEAAYELNMAILSAQTGDAASLSTKFSDISRRFSGTQAGDEAQFYLGKLRLQEHKPDEALQAFEEYLRSGSKGNYLYPASLAGKASALEDLARFGEAAQFYLNAAEFKSKFFAEASLRLDAARCFVGGGDLESARRQYQLVVERYPQTSFSQKAEDGLAKL